MIDNLLLGFKISLSYSNLVLCFIGCTLGTIIGILPGIGSCGNDCYASHVNLQTRSDIRNHHACWNLLRGPVWGYHYLSIIEDSRRSVDGCDLY